MGYFMVWGFAMGLVGSDYVFEVDWRNGRSINILFGLFKCLRSILK